ncbi:UDP-N-acetylmuramate--L-alanine ligase [Autumnicola musiva]|uniref:UDP-N-acetylmuramate--L-alanine ligase n=1 Tax=Autumnicola musiva TaxID=3075589 RepID=A0ABU3D2T6_9FLAO|nr:UDP-N-acetylmuramate--L-alanine ligase [Zunongwangia sp. F117]MDT0675726.1 UDP-N-acetylmuramate--L-alanine ligase [Zunongwangia sp. F117]
MNESNNIQNLYFIGIGGIGMSALARYFNAKGKNVSGYDKTSTSLTRKLEEEGVTVIYKDEIGQIPQHILEDKNSLIVYTPAIPSGHKQYNYFLSENYSLKKRSVVLGLVTRNKLTLAVAGTHGKTTTTAILAHILKETGAKITAFLGGISEDIQNNLIMQGDDVIVAEADEFDRSFLQLSPNIAAITSMDADHLDIYGENEQLQESFRRFASLVPANGKLFVRNGLPLEGATVGVDDKADFSAINIKIEKGAYHFDFKTPQETLRNLKFYLPGKHNLLNAVTALAMAVEYGAPTNMVAGALSSFKGVKRRFSYKINSEKLVLIDDYAHHPAEISAVHQAVREMHPGKNVLAVFQPHLFSRTKDFADEFAESLGKFDQVMLLDIYPARELPVEGITSAWLLDKINNPKKALVQKENLSAEIKAANAEVVVMMGAGDIGEEVEKVKLALQ